MSTDIPVEERVYMKDLHFDHLQWMNEMAFYKEELKIFTHRLEHIAKHNTKQEIMQEVERFQNHFIRQNEVIDEFVHKVKEHEHHLAEFAEEHPIALDHVHFQDHVAMRDEFNTFVKIYMELKTDFNRFLAKRM
jgi:hypothetical protein